MSSQLAAVGGAATCERTAHALHSPCAGWGQQYCGCALATARHACQRAPLPADVRWTAMVCLSFSGDLMPAPFLPEALYPSTPLGPAASGALPASCSGSTKTTTAGACRHAAARFHATLRLVLD